jgi:hypothetical protein
MPAWLMLPKAQESNVMRLWYSPVPTIALPTFVNVHLVNEAQVLTVTAVSCPAKEHPVI